MVLLRRVNQTFVSHSGSGPELPGLRWPSFAIPGVSVPEPSYGSALMGDCYKGMKPGAMLFLHQYLGNPTLIVIDGDQGCDLPEFVQD